MEVATQIEEIKLNCAPAGSHNRNRLLDEPGLVNENLLPSWRG